MAKYQQYEEYKDSGVEWLGEIPEHWEVKPLKYLIKAVRGAVKAGPFGSHLKNSDMQGGDVKVVTQQNVISNDIHVGDSFISFKKYRELRTFKIFKNDVLITTRGTIGRTYVYDTDETAILHPCLIRIQLDKAKADTHFVSLVIQESGYALEQILINSNATTIEVIYSDNLINTIIAIPNSLEEQIKILNYVESKKYEIDTLIEKQQTLIQLLKEKRQAVISHAVTKGLNPDAPIKDSGIEWLGEVPEHWVVCRIKDLSSIISKGTTPSTMGGELIDEGIRFLKAENIGKSEYVKFTPEFYISQKVNDQLARSKLEENDVLVIIAGATTGMASILQKELLPCNTNQAVSFIRPKNPIHSKWIAKWLSIEFSQRIIWMGAVQAAQPNLSMEDLGNIPITFPIGNEVAEIVKVIDIKLEKFDRLISKAEQAIQLMQERRTALISAAVTGKIDVRSWIVPE